MVKFVHIQFHSLDSGLIVRFQLLVQQVHPAFHQTVFNQPDRGVNCEEQAEITSETDQRVRHPPHEVGDRQRSGRTDDQMNECLLE
mgnify:CR=1 FL=1